MHSSPYMLYYSVAEVIYYLIRALGGFCGLGKERKAEKTEHLERGRTAREGVWGEHVMDNVTDKLVKNALHRAFDKIDIS